jgi:hypothetical protein
MQTLTKTASTAALALLITASNGVAQTNRWPDPQRAPGQVVEMVGKSVTVVKTVHYQVMLSLTCGGGASCFGHFPSAGNKRQLNITRMSCLLQASNGASTFDQGQIVLLTAGNASRLTQQLPVNFSSSNGYHLINRAVDMEVPTGMHLFAVFQFTSGIMNAATCTATGTLSVLR